MSSFMLCSFSPFQLYIFTCEINRVLGMPVERLHEAIYISRSAVVRHKHDQRVVEFVAFFQRLEDVSNYLINFRNHLSENSSFCGVSKLERSVKWAVSASQYIISSMQKMAVLNVLARG